MEEISLNLDKLAEAVSNIDSGCASCITSFLNQFPRETSGKIVNMIKEKNYGYYIFNYDERCESWVEID